MTRENTRILNYDLLISHHNLKPKKKVILCLVQTGDKKACHVAIFIHSPLLSRRQDTQFSYSAKHTPIMLCTP